jgi:hypothetical protein
MKLYPFAIAAGAVLGTAAILVGSGTAATENANTTSQQLLINQRISQAAVRRSNSALNYLAPIRTTQSDAANTGANGVTPLSRVTGSGKGWTTAQIADKAVTGAKMADSTVTNTQLASPIYKAIVNGSAPAVASSNVPNTSVARVSGQALGAYTVTFPATNVSACTFSTALQGAAADAAGAGYITVAPVAGNTAAVNVTTWQVTSDVGGVLTNALADRTFHLTANC